MVFPAKKDDAALVDVLDVVCLAEELLQADKTVAASTRRALRLL